MIVAVVITSMILGALAAVFVTSSRSTSATSHRSNQAGDAQIIASFLVKDAQAAGGVDPQTGLNDPTLGVFTIGSSSCSVTGTVLRFRWLDRSGVASYEDAVYRLSGNRLTRTRCETPLAGGSTTPTPATTLANTIESSSATCTTGATTGACNDGSNGQPQLPDSVHLLISATRNSNPANGDLVGSYSYTLTANLRPARLATSDIPNSDNSASAALITLGSGCSPGINLENNADLKVYGDILVNQNCSPTLANGADLLYHTLTTDSGVTNPFSSLQPPSNAGMPSRAGCPGGVAQPGFYAATITLGNNGSCTFQSGIYILNHGIAFGNGASISTASGGALLYFPNEPLSGGNNARINLAAMTSGPYAGLAVWEQVSGSTDLSNNGLLVIAGTLYAPNALIHFSNNAGSPTITAVIALGVDFKNNATASFGPLPKALGRGRDSPPSLDCRSPVQPSDSGDWRAEVSVATSSASRDCQA